MPVGETSSTSGRDRTIALLSRYGTLIFLALLIVMFTVLSEIRLDEQRFFTGGNLSLILRQSAVLAILAAGLTIPLILASSTCRSRRT